MLLILMPAAKLLSRRNETAAALPVQANVVTQPASVSAGRAGGNRSRNQSRNTQA